MGNRSSSPPAARTLMFIGDTHIGDSPQRRWTKFQDSFLADPYRPAGIVHIGDLTENGEKTTEVPMAQAWWARFPDPKTLCHGDHDLLQSTVTEWEGQFNTTSFKTVDFGFVAIITTHYLWTTTIRDNVIAAAAAVAPKPVYLCHHRPLRDTTTAGTAPHDNLSASAPSYTYAMSTTEDGYVRAAIDASPNIVAAFNGHSHAWLDDPGCAISINTGTRLVSYINCSSITYVGAVKQFFTDPLIAVFVTLKPDNKTIEVRYRDYGAQGIWTFFDRARGRMTALAAT